MKLLKEKIEAEGKVLSDSVLKVDAFLNQQVDPVLMQQLGREFAQRFSADNITKVLTLESSGIAPALMAALQLGVPLLFARKKKSVTMTDNCYSSTVYSFTKKEANDITIDKKFIKANDRILIVDDFMANGEAALGLIDIVEQAGARVSGIGIVIEKSFQPGGAKIRSAGYQVESLVKIASLENNTVQFADDDEAQSTKQLALKN